jgi:hypothetical protein
VYHFLKVTVNGTSVTVSPMNAAGATFDAVTYNFAADTTAPTAPSALTATTVTTTVRLNWTGSKSTDVSAQDVYRNGLWLATIVDTARTYTDRAPIAGSSYTVRAHDLRGNQSPNSNAVIK